MQDPIFVQRAFSRIADRYVLTNHVLSMGTDILWRKKVARLVALQDPRLLLDLATGSGDLAAEIVSTCPELEIIGADFCQPMLSHARKRGLQNLIVADGLQLPFADEVFDAVTVAFGLRNMADWPAAVAEMHRVLKSGGRLIVLDFSLPSGILRRPYTFYLNNVLPRIAGLLTGQRDAYDYLSKSVGDFPSGEKMVALLKDCGFCEATADALSFGIASVYVGTR
ncbi:MAG: demethylmenaquinone methyltransferase/2-methoxy-6-polyprenyl-1,4-benzoquinol methylase [Verrucomicrobiales bacterium]|jgi:demethylmenaquinone methyltransferase/2-methoxy-6-polyprenyl-1,4-benzoquinol methylase